MLMRKMKRWVAAALAGAMLTVNLPSDNFRSNAEETVVAGAENAEEIIAEESEEPIAEDAENAEETIATESDVTDSEREEENGVEDSVTDADDEKQPSFAEALPGVPLEGMNFDSKELLIGTDDVSVFTWDTEVVSGYEDVYLTRFATAEETKNAYTYYYGKAGFISPNITFSVSDEEGEGLPDADLSGLNRGDDALAVLNGMDMDPAVPEGTIALIDTGVNAGDVFEKVSLVGGDASDDNGHGSRIYAYIREEYPQAEVLSIKALGADGKGHASDIYAAIRYAAERKVSVINLSISAYSTADNAVIRTAIEEAAASGITVVGAAGNNGSNAGNYIPGGISDALIVGSCDENGVRRSSSNYGATVDFNVVAGSTSEAAARMSAFVSAGMTENEKVFAAVDKEEKEESGQDEDILYFHDTPIFSVADQTVTVTVGGETVTIPNVPDSISVTLDAAGKKNAPSYGPNRYPDGTYFTFPGQQVSGSRGYCIMPSAQPATVGSVGTDYELGNYFGEGTYTYRISDTVTTQRDGYITMTLNSSAPGFSFLPGNAWCCQSAKDRTRGLSGTGNLIRVSDTSHYRVFVENGKKYIYIPYYNQGFAAGASEESDEQRIGYSAYLKYEVPGDFYLSVEKKSESDTVKPDMSGIVYALYPSGSGEGGPFIKFSLNAEGKTDGTEAGYTGGDYGSGYTYVGQETVNGVVYAHLKSNTGALTVPAGHFVLAEYSTNTHYELNTAEYSTPVIQADSYLVIRDVDPMIDTPYLFTSVWKTEKSGSGEEKEPSLSMDGIQYTLKDSKGNGIAVFTLDQEGYCREISGFNTSQYTVISASYGGHTQKILRGTVNNLSSGCRYVETATNRNYVLDATPISAVVFSDASDHVTITGTQAAMQITLENLGVKGNANITKGSDRLAGRDFYISVEKKSGSDTVKPDMSGVVYALYPSASREGGPFIKFIMDAGGRTAAVSAGYTGNDYGNGYTYVGSYTDSDTGVVYAHLRSDAGALTIPAGHFVLAEYSTNTHYGLNTAEYSTPVIQADSYLVIKDVDPMIDTPYLFTSVWKTEKSGSGENREPSLSMDGIQYTLKDSKGNGIAVFTLDQEGYCRKISGFNTSQYTVISASYGGHTQKILRGTVNNLSSGCKYVETATNRNYVLDATPISAVVFSDASDHVTITGTQAAMQIALEDLGAKENENITKGSDRIAYHDFYISVEKKSGSDTVKPDMSGVVYALYPSASREGGPFIKFTMGADGRTAAVSAGYTGNDYGNGYTYVGSYTDSDTGVVYAHLRSVAGALTIPAGHFVITEYSANSHYEMNDAEYATPLIRADEHHVIRDTDPLIETPFLFTSFWKGEKDENGTEISNTLSMEGIKYTLYDTKNNRIAVFVLDADGYCREITGYNSSVYTVFTTVFEGHTQKILRGNSRTLSAQCRYVETETNGNYILDEAPVYAKVFTDADYGAEITGPQTALQITLADGEGEKDNPNITRGFDQAKKNYYIAFRKLAGGKALSDVSFDLWVNGTKLKKQAYTGWYLDAEKGTYPNSEPSKLSIYRGAKPFYTDSEGNRRDVPDGMAIVCLGRFDSAPVVQIRENWTGDQQGTLIDGTEKKPVTAKDYVPAPGSGSKCTYAASAVCGSVENAISYVTGAATGRNATWENESVYVCIQKESADPACSEGNINYSLEGAEFALYNDEAEARAALSSRNFDTALTTLITDAKGKTPVINVTRWMRLNISNELTAAGTWFYAVEKKAPKNYRLADGYAYVNVKSGNDLEHPAVLVFEDEPLTDPISARVIKRSDNESLTEGLPDAEFTIRFYPEDITANYTYDQLQNKQEDESRRLVVRTKRSASGRIQAELPAGTDFPIGYITIEETRAPENYLLPGAGDKANVKVGSNTVETDVKMAFVLTAKADGRGGYESGWPYLVDHDGNRSVAMASDITLENELIFRDREIRGSMELDKADAVTGEPLEGVGFRLDRVDENKNILETHCLYTDAAGHATTVTAAYTNINYYDDHAYDQTEASVWFGGDDKVDVKDGDMALPKGDYILTELRTPANSGYHLPAPFEFSIVNDGDMITVHTFSDGRLYNAPKPPALKTVAAAVLSDEADDRLKMVPANKNQTISDSVSFANLRVSTAYTLVGEIWELTEEGPVPLEMNGQEVRSRKTFTTREMTSPDRTEYCVSGTEEVLFTGLDFTGLQGRSYVVYETLYLGTETEGENVLTNYPDADPEDEAVFPMVHRDPEDEDQQFHTPDGPTEAKDSSGAKTITYTDTVTIVDTVNYTGLVPGREYEIKGVLHIRPEDDQADKEYTREELDAMILRDEKGDPVESSKTFTPTEPDGSAEMEFTFAVDLITGTTSAIVCFEDCTDKKTGISVFTHADIHDKDQTVYHPEIRTMAGDEYGRRELAAESERFFDEIFYDDLEAGTRYRVVGTAMNRKTKEKLILAGGEVTAEDYFTTGKANKENGAVTGSFRLEFTVTKDMQKDLPGTDMVIYETLFVQDKETGEWREAARHHEIDDEGQRLRVPTIGTEMKDKDTGVHAAFPDQTVTLVDVVAYTNLIPGKAYEMEGTLHIRPRDGMQEEVLTDRDGIPVTAKVQFTAAETGKGTVEMTFTFSADPLYLAGRSVVAFESCMPQSDKIPVAVHADINDKGQTVDFPEIGTSASMTGKRGLDGAKTFAVTDRISYENLNTDYEYVARGWLVDPEGNRVVLSGVEIAAEKAFRPTEKDGYVDVTFPEFTVPEKTSFTYIVFEEVYVRAEQADGTFAERPVAEHKQLSDSNQTVSSAYLKTTLLDQATGTHVAYPGQKITLVDTVQYSGLIPGKEYRLAGTLMNKATGRELTDGEGKAVTAEEVFRASETGDGKIGLTFTFDSEILEKKGTSVVAFERCYPKQETVPVCVHTDINDREQEVDIPEVGTAAGKTKGDTGRITVTDVITYKNLNTGYAYVVRGTLVDQSGNPALMDGRTVAAEVTFRPDAPDGEVSVIFPEFAPVWNKDYDITETRVSTESDTLGVKYEYKKSSWSYAYVAFEEVYLLDEKGGEHLVGEHKDLTAGAQTVTDTMTEEGGSPTPPADEETPPPDVKTPQTGDDTPLIPVILLFTIAFMGTAVVTGIKRRMRRR